MSKSSLMSVADRLKRDNRAKYKHIRWFNWNRFRHSAGSSADWVRIFSRRTEGN